MINCFFTPNDKDLIGENDCESIQNAIDKASATGVNKVVIPKVNMRTGSDGWALESAVLLPSDIYVVLDNCRITYSGNVGGNIFRSANTELEICGLIEGEQHNIVLSGVGEAVLSGANAIFYRNICDFVIENISFTVSAEAAVHLFAATRGRLSNLKFEGNGNGVSIHVGSSALILEGISGNVCGSLIAVNNIGGCENRLLPHLHNEDVRNIFISGIRTDPPGKPVIEINARNNMRVFNVQINNAYNSGASVLINALSGGEVSDVGVQNTDPNASVSLKTQGMVKYVNTIGNVIWTGTKYFQDKNAGIRRRGCDTDDATPRKTYRKDGV